MTISGVTAGHDHLRLDAVPYPAIRPRDDHMTEGVLYHALTLRQLEMIDRYEQGQYVRTRVRVSPGQRALLQAWTYVLHPRYYRRISRRPWSFNTFQSRHRASYLSGLCGRNK